MEFETIFIELEKMIVELTKENLQLKQHNNSSCASGSDQLFADWILRWLCKKKTQVKINTYDAYCNQVQKHIEPYFRSTGLMLSEITTDVLEQYYALKYDQGLSGETLNKHHSNINSALKDAVRNKLIQYNPAEVCIRPAKEKFQASFLTSEQFYRVLTAIDQPVMRTAIFLAGSLGLRRSEILGLRWTDIDFDVRSLCVQHTLTRGVLDGKNILIASDIPKTKTSLRTLPLPRAVAEYLISAKKLKDFCALKNKEHYNKNYMEYVCVDELGNILQPNRLSKYFANLVKRLGYTGRFHDLRHTCASLLIQNGVPLKYVSQWLGHSSLSTTSDVYVHLTFRDKMLVADEIDKILTFGSSRSFGTLIEKIEDLLLE